MSIARQLLSHGFLVAAILLVLLGYIFRDDLFTNDAANQMSSEKNNANSPVDEPVENGETVVITAEVATQEMAASEQLSEKEKSLDTQSAYRPDIEPEPVYVDIDEEIKKIAPPLVDLEKNTETNVIPETSIPPTDDTTAIDIVDSNSTVEIQDAVDANVDATESSESVHSSGVDESYMMPAEQNLTDTPSAPGNVEPIIDSSDASTVNVPSIRESAGIDNQQISQSESSDRHPNTEPQETEEQKSLRYAREAFWNGDIKNAIEKYEVLIAASPDNPDFYGELGNVYYANGKWSDAASMYYEAGVRLKSREQYGPAMQMVSILRRLQSEKADILEKSVSEVAWPAQQE